MSPGRCVRMALGLGAAVLAVSAAALGWSYLLLHRAHAGWEGQAVEVTLEPGLDARTMLDRLRDAGVLRRPRLLRAWLVWRGGGNRLHAGEYRFERPASPLEVLERLERGDVLLHPVTVPEGLTLAEVAQRLADAGLGSVQEFLQAFSVPTAIRDLDPVAADLEGYLFPDTYNFPRGERPERIASTMVDRFRAVTGKDYPLKAAAVGLDLRRSVILASLIEKETSVPTERAKISRVFHNRLRRGMKLECDPTVLYALHRAGRKVEQLSYEHLRFNSPWNTYQIAGLPRGPIANPGRDSLEAAVQPVLGGELYFVASPAGGHSFSTDMTAHLRAVAQWRRHQKSSR